MACTFKGVLFLQAAEENGPAQRREGANPPTSPPSVTALAYTHTHAHTYIHTHNDIQIHFSPLAAVAQDRSFHLFFWPQLPVLELVFTYIVHPFRASIGFV